MVYGLVSHFEGQLHIFSAGDLLVFSSESLMLTKQESDATYPPLPPKLHKIVRDYFLAAFLCQCSGQNH